LAFKETGAVLPQDKKQGVEAKEWTE